MPRNSNGRYSPPSGNPVTAGTVITAEWGNATVDDIGDCLTNSLTVSGTTIPVANQQMGGFRHTGASNPAGRAEYLTAGMAQDGTYRTLTITSGTNNLVGSLVGWTSAQTSYTNGMMIAWVQPANNTDAVTVTIGSAPTVDVLDRLRTPVADGDLLAGRTYMAYYNDGAFSLISEVSSGEGTSLAVSPVTGWIRPSGTLSYPAVTSASTTTVNIPAGSGRICHVGANSESIYSDVSWAASVATLSYVASNYATTLMISASGDVVQLPAIPTASALRSNIYLCTISHVAGVIGYIYMNPAVFADDAYLSRDTAAILTNTLIQGGKVTSNTSTPAQVDISEGTVFSPGANGNSYTDTNFGTIAAATAINFYPLAGESTLGAIQANISTVVTNWDNAGVVTALTGAAYATVHRLYWMQGQYIWVYGQQEHATLAAALANLAVDRSNYVLSTRLSTAVLLAEIITSKNSTANLTDTTKALIISGSSHSYGFGGSGSIADAPADSKYYGRYNNTWTEVVAASSPSVTGNVTITKQSPRVVANYTGADSAYGGVQIQRSGFDWFTVQVSPADNATYLRAHDKTTGTLLYTTKMDLLDGSWTYSSDATYSGSGGIRLPSGNTAARPSLGDGTIRYNSETGLFEGRAAGVWGSLGSGSGGGGGGAGMFYTNETEITADYTLAADTNAMTVGPVTIGTGITVTIPAGSNWVVL